MTMRATLGSPGDAPGTSGDTTPDPSGPDGAAPRRNPGWIRFSAEPTGASTKRAVEYTTAFGLILPLFTVAVLCWDPHLRSVPALVTFLLMLAAGSVYMVRELQAQRDGRYEWFNPNWSLIRTSSIIIELGFFGLAVGLHGGVLLLMPCTAFLLTALLGNLGMIAVGWAVLVATLGVESGLQLPAGDAFWLTVLFAGSAAITAMMLHVALEGTLYGIDRNQSLAVLASYAGTLRRWPGDLEPIAGRLAETLDIDRYVIYDGAGGSFHAILSWPDPGWPEGDELGDLPALAAGAGQPINRRELVAAPASASGVDIVLVTPSRTVLRVPVDVSLLDTAAALLAAMCGRAHLVGGLVDLANTDELTGIANRRRLFRALGEEMARSRRASRTFAVAILDLDHFKEYNDRSGHVAGDRMLQRFCALVGQRIRAQDLLARYGGEEFCVVLPETDLEGAVVLVDDIRRWMSSDGGVDGVTFSAGVAAWDGAETVDEMVLRADRHLYVAKSTGRNRVVASAT